MTNGIKVLPNREWYSRQEVVAILGIAYHIQAKLCGRAKVKLVPEPTGELDKRNRGYTRDDLMAILRAYGYTEVWLEDKSPAMAARVFKL